MSAVLQAEDLAVRFGGIQAVAGVSFAIERGDFVGLIGPNGAGKTTLIRLVCGLQRPDRGRVLVDGVDVSAAPTARRVRAGLALTHQIVRPFRGLSVLDNVVLAAGIRRTAQPWRALFGVARHAETERAAAILTRVGLAGTERKLAGALPLGQLKRLEVARALAVEPQVILFDEPLAGLNHAEAAQQMEVLAAVNAAGIAVLLVEHNLEEVMRVCRRLIVLNNGALIGDGAPRAVMADPVVHEAYVGGGMSVHAEA